ncbi:MAG: transporter substrate-binding domain-containing protein [Motiliproteus sp.]
MIRFSVLLVCFFWLSLAQAVTLKALMQDSQPKYFLSGSGEQGLCNEIYHELSLRLVEHDIALAVSPGFTPIKRILHLLEEGQADLFCGAGRNARREALFHYMPTPVYQVSNVLLGHRDEQLTPADYDEMAAVSSSIAVISGTSSAAFLKKKGALAVLELHEIDKAISAVALNERIRYFYYHDLGLNYALRNSELPIQVMPVRYRTVPQWLLVSRETPAPLREIIAGVLAAMEQDGSIAAINTRFGILGN